MSMTTFSLCPICHARVGKTGHICDIPTPPRGEPIPQTVDSLQAVMAKDAVFMERQGQEISKLKQKNNQLRQKNAALQKENAELRNECAKGVHTCHANCPRPMCVLTRENEALKAALAEIREILDKTTDEMFALGYGDTDDFSQAVNSARHKVIAALMDFRG